MVKRVYYINRYKNAWQSTQRTLKRELCVYVYWRVCNFQY